MAMPPPYFDYDVPLSGAPNQQNPAYTQYYPGANNNAPVSASATTSSSFIPSTSTWIKPPVAMSNSTCVAGTCVDPFGRRGSAAFDDSGSAKTKSPSPDRASSTRTSSTSSASAKMSSRESVSSKSSVPSVGSTSSSSSKRKSRSSARQDSTIILGGDNTKRDKFLERNRVAASKCRQRKKEWINGLEEAKNGLETQNSHLQMEYNGLLGEVSRMKNQIMAHANCHDPNIDKWIDNEARRFVQGQQQPTEYQQPIGFAGPGSYPNPGGPSFAMNYEGYADEGTKMSPTQAALSADIANPLGRPEERDRRSIVCA